MLSSPIRLLTCSLTFAAPGCQQPWRLPKIIWDLDISSKHNDGFDHIQVVMLGEQEEVQSRPRLPLATSSLITSFPFSVAKALTRDHPMKDTARISEKSVPVSALQEESSSASQQSLQKTHLHGQVQRCVAILTPGIGVGAVCQQYHGTVKASPIDCDVQSHVRRPAGHIHLGTVLKQQPRHLCPSMHMPGQ